MLTYIASSDPSSGSTISSGNSKRSSLRFKLTLDVKPITFLKYGG